MYLILFNYILFYSLYPLIYLLFRQASGIGFVTLPRSYLSKSSNNDAISALAYCEHKLYVVLVYQD